MKKLFILPIRFYQRYLRCFLPPSCRFIPSCSDYAIESIERFGLMKGCYLSTKRICRCQPFCQGGHDPVPVE
ncbi:MAG: membrane protein insertion efficiency factor YidD [Pseudomonadota bacterium]